MPRRKKRSYDATMRFRAFEELGKRILRVVVARGHGDASDIMREGTINRVEEEEKRLGLPPIEEKPAKKISYSKAKKKK